MMLSVVTLSLSLERTSFDLLDGVDIDVAVHNSAKSPATITFAQPAEYEIEIDRDGTPIWTSNPKPAIPLAFPAHKKQFLPGPTVLVIYIWNAIDSDGSTPAPGAYTIRAKLLGNGVSPSASVPVHFINPVPTSALAKLNAGDIVTIAGTLDATKGVLSDSSGSIPLMKRLLTAPPDATIAVRGYLTTRPDHTQAFFVKTWAVMR